MELIVGAEEAFGICLEVDDVFEMSDFSAVRAVLRNRYSLKAAELMRGHASPLVPCAGRGSPG